MFTPPPAPTVSPVLVLRRKVASAILRGWCDGLGRYSTLRRLLGGRPPPFPTFPDENGPNEYKQCDDRNRAGDGEKLARPRAHLLPPAERVVHRDLDLPQKWYKLVHGVELLVIGVAGSSSVSVPAEMFSLCIL
jgi:hypothetical protein